MLTIEQVTKALPTQLKTNVDQGFVDQLNKISSDPVVSQNIRENFISYSSILREGRFKIEDYTHAVAYVSYKIMGYTNKDAYIRTFPQRYQVLTQRGASDKDISSYVAAYNKNKLVNLILEQTLIPMWVVNQDIYQKAINTQADLMQNARSEKVRSDAANSLLTHLKKPESKKVELDIGMVDKTGLSELNEQLRKMTVIQQDLIHNGMTTKQIAHQNIVEAEVIEE